jgi:predicted DCC family thiol-disulfide oxidoreductase YuxK
MQTGAGERIMQQHGIGPGPPESIVLVENGKVWYRSSAALRIARRMRRGWPLFCAFIVLPPFIRDFFYNIIARNRYRWFGKRASCFVPSEEIRGRFL